MNIIQITKRLCIGLMLTIFTIFSAYADEPEISERYPTHVNLNTTATLLFIGQNLESPLTITIGNEVIPVINNADPTRVTCTISARSMPDFVSVTVQNDDGACDNGVLYFYDCSSFVQIDTIIRSQDYIITINNACYSTYEYQLNTESIKNADASTIRLSDLAEGPHQLTIIGHDQAQNTHSRMVSFTVDTIEPEIQLDYFPPRMTTNDSETISVTSLTGATTYKYQLDNKSVNESSLSDPIYLTSLSLGVHTLLVYGCDSNSYCQAPGDAISFTWTIIDIAFAENSALSTTNVLAGTESGLYSINCEAKDVFLEWSVYNYDGNQMGETIVNETFSYTPEKIGAYAGVYTVDMSAKVDNQTLKTIHAYINVPFDIETDRYNIIEEAVFSVKGVKEEGYLIPDFKPNIYSNSSATALGDWSRTKPTAKDIIFKPSDNLDKVTSFDVWMSVKNDLDLNETNGLNEQTTGPFFIIPLKNYSIALADEEGCISTTTNTDITIKEMVTQTNTNLATAESTLLTLPASGGTYFFKVIDNKNPPEYLPGSVITKSYESTVTLQPVGDYIIEGKIQDSKGNVLENVTVTAFQPVDEIAQAYDHILPRLYEAKTEINGQYKIYLPESTDIGEWTVIAGKEGYKSAFQTNQQANTEVSFYGLHALQLQTQITRVWTENDRINIEASPAFDDCGEINILKLTKDGKGYDAYNHLNNETISIAKPDADEYTLLIYADTTDDDDHDPEIGNYVCHAYRKDSCKNVLARTDKTMDIFGGTLSLNNNKQEANVEIPVNGLSETATITIEQIEKAFECNATTGTKYIYAVHAISVNSGHSLTDDQINQVAVTLPFDLRTIHPGAIENGTYNVYRADSLEELKNHETELIYDIRQSDYMGTGKLGSVTVLVDDLSYFAIGVPPEKVSVSQSFKDEGGGDCFIGILQ
jgi:hypothetical protein